MAEPLRIIDVAGMDVEERTKVALLFLSHISEMETDLLVRVADTIYEQVRLRNGGQAVLRLHVG